MKVWLAKKNTFGNSGTEPCSPKSDIGMGRDGAYYIKNMGCFNIRCRATSIELNFDPCFYTTQTTTTHHLPLTQERMAIV